ncbi:hypothetical protein EYZ11_011942 [Aspergillus tanneri]|nr:hypothetical protein EYZ11_011942 [Aspergillus tanneri]
MFVADPRDQGRAGALASAGNSSAAPVASCPSPSSSAAHPTLSLSPRVPQSRFSFEYQSPLRKRALTSYSGSAVPAVNAFPSPNRDPAPTPTPIQTPTPQRTPLYDRHRRSVPSFNLPLSHLRAPTVSASQPSSPRLALEEESDSALPLDATGSTVRVLSPNATKRRKQSFHAHQTPPDVKRRMPSSTVSYSQGTAPMDERNRAVNGFDKGSEDGARTPIADDSRLKNDDLFLNIARSDSSRRESLGRSDLRRSRFRMSGSGLRSPASRTYEQTPSPDQLRSNTYDSPLHSNNGSPSNVHSSGAYSYSVSAHPLEDHSRSHHSSYAPSSRSTIGLQRSRQSNAGPDSSPHHAESNIERRASLQDPRLFRHSTLSTIRSSRQVSTSEATERARVEPDRSRLDGTESTLSTTAPSTVWDELEDLKSRIRKLELTGKLPPSSQEAISASERPRTATTTVTTVSSSPKHGRRTSNPSADADTITVNPVHPILQSAMAKAKNVLSNGVYSTLEATVIDALTLSNLLGSSKAPSSGASGINGYSSSERQSRRKADSVCRSLTELCLALSDEQIRKQHACAEAGAQQCNGTNEGTSTPMLTHQQTNQDPEGISRRRSTRVASRLEARRASLVNPSASPSAENSSNTNRSSDSTLESQQTQSLKTSVPMSRLNRLSTSLRMKRLQTEDETAASASPHSRSISRSMTESETPASSHRSPRMSYGYTTSQSASESQEVQTPRFSSQTQQSQLPQPRTPTVSQSGIPLRRSLITPTSYTPATPRTNIQAGSRRYGLSTATINGANENVSFAQQEPSQTRIHAPSSKLATSYTTISQNRLRANSLGTRRFGLRHRPVAGVDGVVNLDDSID